MKKKRGILFALILVIGIAGTLWTFMHDQKPIPVQGYASARDVADIRRVIKHDLRRNIFPAFSWTSFKGLPGRIKIYLRYELLKIAAPRDSNLAFVYVRLNPLENEQNRNSFYTMTKSSGRWEIIGFTMTYSSPAAATSQAAVWTASNPLKPASPPPLSGQTGSPLSVSPTQSLTGLLLGPETGAPTTRRRFLTRTYVRGVTVAPATNTTNAGAP